MKFWNNFLNEEDGQDLVEMGLILALVSVAAVVSLTAVGTNVKGVFDNVVTKLAPGL